MEWKDFQASEFDGLWYDNMPPPSPQFNVGQSSNAAAEWSFEENKVFEKAIAEQTEVAGSDAFYQKLATLMPYKSMQDIMAHYGALVKDVEMIESGLVPIPEYKTPEDVPAVTVNLVEEESSDDKTEMRSPRAKEAKKTSTVQRRRGIPWTEDEHQLFLMGLNKYGKGDWRSISRYYVTSKTPTQIASHAQKYFRRQTSSTPIERRRPSIHDIHTVGNVAYTRTYTPLSTFTANSFPAPVPMPFQAATPYVNNYPMAGQMPFQMFTGFMNNNYMAGMNTNFEQDPDMFEFDGDAMPSSSWNSQQWGY